MLSWPEDGTSPKERIFIAQGFLWIFTPLTMITWYIHHDAYPFALAISAFIGGRIWDHCSLPLW